MVVDVIACGVCHTDLTYREGGVNEYPFLLGHQAAGVVERHARPAGRFRHPELARGLRRVPGLRAGPRHLGFDTHNAAQKMTLTDGTESTPALGMGAAINTGVVNRDDTVAVTGCGVGDAAIAASNLVGVKRIVAVDTGNTRLDWARDFGATHTINATRSWATTRWSPRRPGASMMCRLLPC